MVYILRKIDAALKEWNPHHKPLLLHGARQTIKLAFVAAMAFCAFGAWAGSGDICSYLEPVYNGTDGNPTNGIAYWETKMLFSDNPNAHIVGNSGSAVTWGEAGATNWYVVQGADVQINGGITCVGHVNLVLCNGAKLTVTGGGGMCTSTAGIRVGDESSSLTIYGESDDEAQMGELFVESGVDSVSLVKGAAIGGSVWQESGLCKCGCYNVTINGGKITAADGCSSVLGEAYVSASIPLSGNSDCRNVTINGGVIMATNCIKVGIGVFDNTSVCSNLTINGGAVMVNGGAFGIGGATVSGITINGGKVEATSSAEAEGVGIGGATVSGVTINGGTVEASTSCLNRGVGIGGFYVSGITINGGEVKATGSTISQPKHSVGIGGMSGGVASGITINGGVVTAQAAIEEILTGVGYSGAGIGHAGRIMLSSSGEYEGVVSNITINGGTVTAKGVGTGAGIGGANASGVSGVAINGGTVTAIGGEYAAGIGTVGKEGEAYTDNATNIFVAAELEIKAGGEMPPTAVIDHVDDEDLAVKFKDKRYVTIALPLEPVEYTKPVYVDNVASNGIAYWETNEVSAYTEVASATGKVTWGVAGATSWYVVKGADVQIDGNVTCTGHVNLVLCDGAKLTVTGTETNAAAIATDPSGSFTVYGSTAGNGHLVVKASTAGPEDDNKVKPGSCAGIGGGKNVAGKNITINGGFIEATGGQRGPGIGSGGFAGAGENIVINGGLVNAECAGEHGAGIGGGTQGYVNNVVINGGTVIATGGKRSAGIGSGAQAKGTSANITINGGYVVATGGNRDDTISAIGQGYEPKPDASPTASGIRVSTAMKILAGDSTPPTTEIANAGGDLTSALAGLRYAVIQKSEQTDDCLTFSSDGAFTLSCTRFWEGTLWTSTNKTTWAVWKGATVAAAQEGGVGDYRLYMRGDIHNRHISSSVDGPMTGCIPWELTPVGDNKIVCSGNIETLRGAKGDAPSPTPMGIQCYREMFRKCTALTKTPALSATNLAEECYLAMFGVCTALTTAPTLPAENLAKDCYDSMFGGCTALTTAPTLTAENLAKGCYNGMFADCTSLTTAPALPASDLAESCYGGMFNGCTALTEAPVLSATNLAEGCYLRMFQNCTSLSDVPELPATVLKDACYGGMFSGCSNLVINTTGLGREWSIPAAAEASTNDAPNWAVYEDFFGAKCHMLEGTGGDAPDEPVIGKTYYIASVQATVTPQTVAHTTTKVYTNDTVEVASPYEVIWGSPVKVVYTAEGGYVFADGTTERVATFTAESNPASVPEVQVPVEPFVPVASVITNGVMTLYGEISNAWAAACVGTKTTPATLTLLTNVTVTTKLQGPSNDDFSAIFDLNDKVITFVDGNDVRISHQHGKLTVVDSAANKTTRYFEPDADGRWARTNAVTERAVKGGYFTGYAWLLFLEGGDVEISDVSFVGAKRNPIFTQSVTDLTYGKCTFSHVNFLGNVGEDNYGGNPGAISLSCKEFQYLFEDCVFRENVSPRGGGAIGRVISGECPEEVLAAPPRLVRCVFENNRSVEADGGAVCLDANLRTGSMSAGAVPYVHPMIFEDCVFAGNEAGGNGGAIAAYCNAQIMLKNCVVTNNAAGGNGGGISMDGDELLQGSDLESKFVLINTTITDNRAVSKGGGVYFAKAKCLAAGTKVMMADGTERAIEEVVEGDVVRTFDHEGGTNATARVYLAFKGESQDVPFTLTFDNGATLSIVGRHDLLEQGSRKYVTITRSNAGEYVGAKFYGADGAWHALTGVTKGTQAADYHSLYTARHQNIYANGMLTVPDDVDYLLNIYELDENLKADAGQLAADIAAYSLATFEECSTKYGMSRSWYEDAGAKYNYVAIGKGLVTLERLEALLAASTEAVIVPKLAARPKLKSASPKASPFDDYSVSVMTLGTNVVITGNSAGGAPSNVYLNFAKGESSDISSIVLLTDHTGICVGVTTAEVPTESDDIPFTTGSVTAGDVVYFTSDEGYSVIFKENALVLSVKPPAVEILAEPTAVEHTDLAVYTNGFLSAEVETGKWAAWSNEEAKVVYTAQSGYYFADGTQVKTNELDTAKNPATAAGVVAPKAPTFKLGVVAQRYPFNTIFDVNYRVANWPQGYGLASIEMKVGDASVTNQVDLTGKSGTFMGVETFDVNKVAPNTRGKVKFKARVVRE